MQTATGLQGLRHQVGRTTLDGCHNCLIPEMTDLLLDTLLPTLDNLRNFLLTATTEVLNFFQQLREQC